MDLSTLAAILDARQEQSFWLGGIITADHPTEVEFATGLVSPSAVSQQGTIDANQCVQYNSFAGALQTKACHKPRFFVCERPAPSQYCPSVSTSGPPAYFYMMPPGRYSHDEATTACRDLSHELAAPPRDQAELDSLVDNLVRDGVRPFADLWVGMQVEGNDQLVYADGAPVNVESFVNADVQLRYRSCGVARVEPAYSDFDAPIAQLRTDRCNRSATCLVLATTTTSTTTTSTTSTTTTSTTSTTTTTTEPITYVGTISCDLSVVPDGVQVVQGSIIMHNCGSLAPATLQKMNALMHVTENIRLTSLTLTNVDFLGSLESVLGYVRFQDHPKLTDLDGLSSLTSVGGYFYLHASPSLTNMDGLGNLATIGNYVYMNMNNMLTNVDGFNSLTSIGGNVFFATNPKITNLDGLGSLTSIRDYLSVSYNPSLPNVDGLSSLTFVGANVTITSNYALTNIDGFGGLTSIDQHLYINARALRVGNTALADVDGFGGLTSIGKSIRFCYNLASNLQEVQAVLQPLGTCHVFSLTNSCPTC
ncbi:uncharacterized protein MONBRDRAFT_24761 [Monosiga brevicollis MX1]|uniref:C-type lectin domain-containing protein n=1 Tax=Monosiga brevicollis TaxID=81824 RepID=A9UXE4_MONBE|nr:uncharacterized protein MONBRDRAFT_24761 [Monosiga brevicollis MX1]EDQ90377.1 predicted protein [Monosiga brevicollis MX1]|eukprot:XP_001745144.1 hypothetical protein [Monosiga brevicollis MX1]